MPLPSSEIVNFNATKRAKLMLKLHETTKQNIECMNAKYRLAGYKGRKELKFEPGELVWLHLRKDRFPELHKSKLLPRAAGPLKVLKKVNDKESRWQQRQRSNYRRELLLSRVLRQLILG